MPSVTKALDNIQDDVRSAVELSLCFLSSFKSL